MSDVQHLHEIRLNGKQDAIDVRSATVEELTHLNGRISILRGQRATSGKIREGCDSRSECCEPTFTRVPSLLGSEPVVDRRDVALGLV